MKGQIAGYDLRKPVWRPTGYLRIVLVVAVAIALAYMSWRQQQNPQPKRPTDTLPAPTANSGRAEAPPAREPAPRITATAPTTSDAHLETPAKTARSPRTTIQGQAIYDQLGNEVFRGEIDVRPTLARIEDGRKLSFANDGSVFQNRERRLPKQPEGYYREYVHPTPGLSGPGPQRIVMGERGEAYYTPDHYRTFRRVDEE